MLVAALVSEIRRVGRTSRPLPVSQLNTEN